MEQQFQPLLKPEFVQNAITLYKKNPRSFNDDFVNQIQTHAEYYQIPFQKDWKDEEFRLLDTIQQAGKGFLEGFTTLKMGEEPKTTSERIARSAGHLAGFVGYVPAVGPKVVKGISQALRGNSLPMYIANKLTDPTKRITGRLVDSALKGRSGAAQDAYKFLNKDSVKGIAEGAFHLGAASAVSAWQGGIDEMAHGFFGGAVAGGGFRAIGQYIQFATPPTGKQLGPNGQPIWKKLDSAQKSDMILRMTAGAMFTGLPSTMRGDTTPEQIYEYLLGGYFGFREAPAVEHFSNKFIGEVSKKSKTERLPLPEDVKGWKDLSPETQARVKEKVDAIFGENYQLDAMLHKLGKQVSKKMEDLGVSFEDAYKNMAVENMSKREGDGKYTAKDVELITGKKHPEKIRQEVEEGKQINKDIILEAKDVIREGEKKPLEIKAEDVVKVEDLDAIKSLEKEKLDIIENKLVPERYEASIPSKDRFDVDIFDKRIPQSEKDWKLAFDDIFTMPNKADGREYLDIGRITPTYKIPELAKLSPEVERYENLKLKIPIEKIDSNTGKFIWKDMTPSEKQISKDYINTHNSVASKVLEYFNPLLKKEGLPEIKFENKINLESQIKAERDIELINQAISGIKEKAPEKESTVTRAEISSDEVINMQESEIATAPAPQTYTNWVEKNAKPLITNKEGIVDRAKSNELSDKIYNEFRDFTKDYTPEKDMDIFYKKLGSLDIPINEDTKSFWRNKVRQDVYNKYRPVGVATIDGDKITFKLTNPKEITLAGNQIKVPEAPSVMEEIYYKSFKEKGGKEYTGERPIIDVQYVTMRKGDGSYFKEYSLGDMKQNFPKEYEKAVSQSIKELAKKDYYYYSGRAAGEQLKFIKHHPNTPKEINQKNVFRRIYQKALVKHGVSSESLGERIYNLSRKSWTDRFGKESGEMYDRAFVSNLLYDLEFNGMKADAKNLKVFFEKGNDFINNVVNFNKRMQIFSTGASPAERKYVDHILQGRDYNIALVEALSDRPSVKKLANKLNIHRGQITDGAVYTRQDVFEGQLKDVGAPPTQKSELKTFIYDPAQKDSKGNPYGAFLSKHMQHRASDALNKEMMDKDIHHIIFSGSASKQNGTRKPIYAWWDNGLKFGKHSKGIEYKGVEGRHSEHFDVAGNFKGYKLSPESFRYVMPETSTSHNIDPARMVKQMWTPFSTFSKEPTNFSALSDMFTTTIDSEFKGKAEANRFATELLLDPKNERLQASVLNKVEDIGFKELFDLMHQKGENKFAGRLIQKIASLKNKDISEMYERGEITESEANALRGDTKDFKSIAEQLLDMYKGELSIQMDKDVSPYIKKVMENFIIAKLTNPRWDNGVTGRMKPYSFDMVQRFPELNKTEDLYLVDTSYKNKRFDIEHYNSLVEPTEVINAKNKTTFGELVDILQNKNTSKNQKENIERFLQVVSLRVPMDSASGARVLKFGGFTESEGWGIYLHGNVMESLGGADLDGDKTWLYFGFKEKWKDLYKKQEKEFYDKDGNYIPSKSKESEKLWVEPDRLLEKFAKANNISERDVANHPILKYSPDARMKASEGAFMGRKLMGTSVVGGQIYTSMYNAVSSMPNNTWFDYTTMTYAKAKTDPVWQNEARMRLRDSVSYSADAANYSGLVNMKRFKENVLNSMFEVGTFKVKNGKKELSKSESYHTDPKALLGLESIYRDINTSLYGRNHAMNRNWTQGERTKKLDAIKNLDPKVHNKSTLYRIGDRVRRINIDDSIIKRVEYGVVEKMYNDYNSMTERMSSLGKVLGRSSFVTKYNNPLKAVIERRLWNPTVRNKIASNKEIYDNFINEYKLTEHGKVPKWSERGALAYLERLYNKSEHFIGNDVKLQTSVKQIYDHIQKNKINKDDVRFYWEAVTDFKVNNYLRAKENSKDFQYTIVVDGKSIPITTDKYERLSIKERESLKATVSNKEKISAKYTQEQVDNQLKELKKGIDKPLQDLIDMMVLTPMQKGNRYHKLESLLSEKIKDNDLISEILQESAKTNTSRIGLYSKEVDSGVKRQFYGMYKDTMNKMMESEPVYRGEEAVAKEAKEIVNEGLKVEGEKSKIPFFNELDWVKEVRSNKEYNIKDPEINKLMNNILSEMNKRPTTVGIHINGIVRDLFQKDIKDMNLQDWRALSRWFKDIHEGTWLGRFMDIPENELGRIPKIFHWMFPETIGRKLMKSDFQLMQKKGLFTKDGKPAEGTVHEPTSTYGKLYSYATKNYHLSQRRQDEEEALIRDDFDYIYSFKDGLKLFELSTYLREKDLKTTEGDSYSIPKKVWKEISSLNNKEYTYLRKGKKETKKGHAIMKQINSDITKWVEHYYGYIGENFAARDKYRLSEMSTEKDIRKSLVEEIKKYEESSEAGKKKIIKRMMKNPIIMDPLYNHDKIFKETAKDLFEGKVPKILKELGVDGLNLLANDIKVAQSENIILKAKLRSIIPKSTGRIDSEKYWMHRDHPKAEVEKAIKIGIEKIEKDTSLTPQEKSQEIAKLVMRMKNANMNLEYLEGRDWMDYDDLVRKQLLDKNADKEFVPDNIIQGTRNMMSRVGNVKGYNRTPEALVAYGKELIDTQHKQLTQIIGRSLIEQFKRKNYKKAFNKKGDLIDAELYKNTVAWTNFHKMYLNEATGMPSVIPEALQSDPHFNVKGTPYGWWADNKVKNRINKIAQGLGLRKSEMDKALKNVDESDLHRWSNLEARYELATLLAHPKAAIANIFGGSALSVMSAGYNNFKKVRDYDWIRRNVSDKLDSKEKQDAFARKHGIIEEMLLNEANLASFTNKEFRKEAWDSIMADITNRVRKGENPDNRTVMEILKQNGVDKNIISKAAYFMTVSERMLRRDSFMTHYIEAFRRFKDVLGPENIDHPFLIEMAKKGVQATQFMYAAPYRPAFTRTALGKVYSRFQLWAWNSVGFRNRVHREAKLYGYTPGTPEFERFKRTAMADLFVLGLANVFTYSLFESALPAPMNWFQDTAEWIFGDAKERDRAFFGQYPTPIAPLQAISPPIMRFPAAMFTAMVDDDWSRVGNYYAWTMFPFGRMARDTKGILENPMMMLEKTTGFPLIKLNKQVKEYQDEDMLYHRVFPRTPPNIE